MQMYDEDPFGITSQVVLQAHVADGCSGAKNPSLLHSTAKGSTVQEVQEAVEECVADFIELYKQGDSQQMVAELDLAFLKQTAGNPTLINQGCLGDLGASREDTSLHLCETISTKIAAPFDVEQLQQQYPATYQESMNTVLVHEAMQYNALLEVVAASLKECAKAVKGLVFTSPSLEVVSDNMYDNQSSSAIIHPFLFKRYKHPSIDGKTNTYLLVPPILPRLMLIPMLMKSLFMSAASNRTRD
ncbi:hypothetical protein WJX77_007133 [Trebouxia sp. C0004]